MSMRSASARPGTRSRSISASATSCISSPTSWCARRRRCWRSGRAGRRRIRTSLAALIRAASRAAEFIEQPENRAEAAHILARPERIGVDAEVIQRTLDGRLKISPDGTHARKRPLSAGRARGRGAARSGAGGLALRADGALGADGDAAGRAQDGHGGLQAGPLRRRHGAAGEGPPALPTPSAPLPAPHSTRTTSPAIWRHSRSATGSPEPIG